MWYNITLLPTKAATAWAASHTTSVVPQHYHRSCVSFTRVTISLLPTLMPVWHPCKLGLLPLPILYTSMQETPFLHGPAGPAAVADCNWLCHLGFPALTPLGTLMSPSATSAIGSSTHHANPAFPVSSHSPKSCCYWLPWISLPSQLSLQWKNWKDIRFGNTPWKSKEKPLTH